MLMTQLLETICGEIREAVDCIENCDVEDAHDKLEDLIAKLTRLQGEDQDGLQRRSHESAA